MSNNNAQSLIADGFQVLLTLDANSPRINDQRIRAYRVLPVHNCLMIIDLATFWVCSRRNLHFDELIHSQ